MAKTHRDSKQLSYLRMNFDDADCIKPDDWLNPTEALDHPGPTNLTLIFRPGEIESNGERIPDPSAIDCAPPISIILKFQRQHISTLKFERRPAI